MAKFILTYLRHHLVDLAPAATLLAAALIDVLTGLLDEYGAANPSTLATVGILLALGRVLKRAIEGGVFYRLSRRYDVENGMPPHA